LVPKFDHDGEIRSLNTSDIFPAIVVRRRLQFKAASTLAMNDWNSASADSVADSRPFVRRETRRDLTRTSSTFEQMEDGGE
jgi:hypothetical protein